MCFFDKFKKILKNLNNSQPWEMQLHCLLLYAYLWQFVLFAENVVKLCAGMIQFQVCNIMKIHESSELSLNHLGLCHIVLNTSLIWGSFNNSHSQFKHNLVYSAPVIVTSQTYQTPGSTRTTTIINQNSRPPGQFSQTSYPPQEGIIVTGSNSP